MSDDVQTAEPPVKKQKLQQINSKKLEDINVNAVLENDFSQDVDTTEAVANGFGLSGDKYKNFVTHEDLEKLREFKVLDEVKSNDEDSNDEDSDSSDGKSEDLPEDEIERMLDEDLPEDFKAAPKPKEKVYITRQKIVLEEKGINQFEVLPLDWMMARHYSGMPIYMHRTTRVCTLSKPYFLGKGNTRRHDIPISAIPCLAYRKALEEEAKQKVIDKQIDDQIKNGTWQQNKDKTVASQQSNKNNENGKNVTETDDSSIGNVNSDKDANKRKCPFLHENSAASIDTPDAVFDNLKNSRNSIKDSDTTCNINNIEGTKKINEYLETDKTLSTNVGKDEACSMEKKLDTDDKNESCTEKGSFAILKHIDENLAKNIKSNDIEMSTIEKDNADTAAEVEKNKKDCNSELNDKDLTNVINESEVTSEIRNDDAVNAELPLNRQPVVLPGGIVMPPPRVETVSTSWKTQHLTHELVNEYCKRLFKFKTVNIMHFKRWADRRKYTKARKTLQYPTLPEGTKLITIPAQPTAGQENGGGGKASKRDWVMNMNGRSYLSVFHEYVRRALHKQPVYEFKQLENASTPYQATVYIGGMQYGVGHGSSKRSAKSAAARASIHILIPEMRQELEPAAPPRAPDASPAAGQEPDFTFFDYVGIEDPRITEFCASTCEPSPHAILRTCLLRNFGAGDRHIHTELKKLEYQKMELTMKVGKHTATVVCKNKKTAKQRASQAILQALHPHVRSWGSLLRLYGSRSVKSCKEKKLEEQQITLLQDAARHNEPNYAVLDKLRNEMRKLRERDEAVVPIGTLLVREDLPTHSGSNLNNVDL